MSDDFTFNHADQGALFPADGEQEPAVTPEPEPDFAAQIVAAQEREVGLQAQLEAERSALSAERSRLDRFLARSPEQPRQPEFDPNDVPDPTLDIDGFRQYQAQLVDHQNQARDQKLAALRAEMETTYTATTLWTQFQQQYPEHAQRTDLARIAFEQVSANGLPQDQGQALSLVKERMDSLVGGPIAGPPTTNANRTAGTSSGSGPVRPVVPPAPPTPVKDQADWMIEQQSQWGLI